MGPRLLLINTATGAGSVALTFGESLVGELLLNLKSTHSDRLLPVIKQLLDDTGTALAGLDAIAVVVGPGAFTGLRVGVATAKGLALAVGKPLIGVSSLQALACQVPCTSLPVCVLLDARKQEVYAGLFQWQEGEPRPVAPERVIPPGRLLDEFNGDVLFLGDGAVAYRTLIEERLGPRAHFAPWVCHVLRAGSAAPLALAAFQAGHGVAPRELLPVYIRASEAEIQWAAKDREALLDS